MFHRAVLTTPIHFFLVSSPNASAVAPALLREASDILSRNEDHYCRVCSSAAARTFLEHCVITCVAADCQHSKVTILSISEWLGCLLTHFCHLVLPKRRHTRLSLAVVPPQSLHWLFLHAASRLTFQYMV